jgi:excinuclease ABC subunit B
VLIGINLLREGLDLPEVSLVAVLDADKEGYLRSATALIQTMGRCARHINGRAILYADRITGSMRQAMDETDRRRVKQLAYNEANGITPQSIIRPVDMRLAGIVEADYVTVPVDDPIPENITTAAELRQAIASLETQMREAAKKFEFERAAALRDRLRALQQLSLFDAGSDAAAAAPDTPATPDESGAPGTPALGLRSDTLEGGISSLTDALSSPGAPQQRVRRPKRVTRT